jgi:hypothetical protein
MKGDFQTQDAFLSAVIQERYRQRLHLHRAEQRLTLHVKAICRRLTKGDAQEADHLYRALSGPAAHPLRRVGIGVTKVLVDTRDFLKIQRLQLDAELERDVRSLAIWPRVAATPGLGALGWASLIGEAGDLARYETVNKLWKRLGLAVINGSCQRLAKGASAEQQGYSPRRRSTVWHIGRNILRVQSARAGSARRAAGRPAGPFRLGYDARKAYELARGTSKGHAHNRAKRYMEKKLIRNIWRAWRELGPALTPAVSPT